MPPKKKSGPTPVDAITHADKRTNIPTADAHEFVAPEIEQPVEVRYPRDPTLDPQLVWKGKDELDGEDLVAEAPPIYIQEKIDPRVLIENLRRTAERSEDEPELTLFESFDGLDALENVEFYEHDANWSNRMILGDSLNVMASLAEREALRGKVQMVYIDPPYGIKFGSNWQSSARKREVKDGKLADATREVEQIKAFRDTWELGIHSYLTYLRDRLVAARDLLTDSGSCFVQIGDENVHLVRSLMDEVFGSENFVADVSYFTTSGRGAAYLDSVSDRLLWYAADRDVVKYRGLWKERPAHTLREQYTMLDLGEDGVRRATRDEVLGTVDIPEGAARFMPGDMSSSGASEVGSQPFEFEGTEYSVPPNTHWKTHRDGLSRLVFANRVVPIGKRLRYKRLATDFPFAPYTNLWDDTVISGFAAEKIYVVQTSPKVIERCLLMATDPGDLVLDPTCGSGTTAAVAEHWGRRWITVDTSRVALTLARQRLMGSRFPYFLLSDSETGRQKESELSAEPLPPMKPTNDIRHGFVYERVQRITLGSIANNPDIVDAISREEIDAAIKRHAEYELLYDKPYEDKKKVRVAGPFTVESLSPHRSLGFAGSAIGDGGAMNADTVTDPGHGDADFEQSIMANLQAAGIQNGRRNERLELDAVETYAGTYIQAVATRQDAEEGTPKRIGITIGSQYGTVGPGFVKDAAREAIKDNELDLLCVLAFAFDPQVLGAQAEYAASADDFAEVAAERRLGRIPVLLVRMNADLVMGEELKKTGAGNLFTVFGEPDVEITKDGDELRVELKGVDVYDPNTGELRSNDTGQIALWMIDTAYDGESFFVRHCYFTGNQKPYEKLKKALKADIDEEAWAELYGTTSRPFARPDSGRIAVKVVNDYGDEVLKVFDV
ncbi:site-specific DNA-methyltransferase [Conexibacter sp. SYSU D00693]|uniref:site-specific DNA-methyltransferase n=1 Tax=Conexibacter sp. SYSU D00693 TaxID=2812560 RepID=UPI00196B9868|nr:site-specific DNA-methyltransferase [Conexibacter sp. SYSU D00693]